MHMNENIIDGHVHLYTAEDLGNVPDNLPYVLPEPHPLKNYLDGLMSNGMYPVLINNVHLSILPDSENVFASFRQLEELQKSNPEKYDRVVLIGTIVANPDYATGERLQHPQIVGVRIVLHDAKPESVGGDQYKSPAYLDLWKRLRADQHIHVYAMEAETNLRVLKQLPEENTVVIDHLGSCYAARGTDEAAYQDLLKEAKRRGNVYFKGPGYRTAVEVEQASPFVRRIIELLGEEKILLQASDAPHVGKDFQGRSYAEMFSAADAITYTNHLAKAVCNQIDSMELSILHGAASKLFPAHIKG